MKKAMICEYFFAENHVSLDQPDSDRRKSAETIRDSVWPKVRSPPALMQHFKWTGEASSGCQPLATVEDAGTMGLAGRIQENFTTYTDTLSDVPAAFALLLKRVWVGDFDAELAAMAQQDADGIPVQFYDFFKGTEVEPTELQMAHAKYNSAWRAEPVSLASTTNAASTAPSDAVDVPREGESSQASDERDNIWKKVCDIVKEVKFFAGSAGRPVDKWNSALAASTVGDKKQSFKKKPVRAWLLSVDLLVSQASQASIKSKKHLNKQEWRQLPIVTSELKAALAWIKSRRQKDDAIIVCDGRSPDVRRLVDNWMETELRLATDGAGAEDRLVSAWVIYDLATVADGDPRMPKKKLAWSCPNRETVSIWLPCAREFMKAQPRDVYTVCGEDSTHNLTYSGVAVRSLEALPRLSWGDRQKITGHRWYDPAEACELVLKATGTKGWPLMWGEWKPVGLWMSVFRDLGLHEVFDLTPGSAAAAVGALYCGVKYDGACENEDHKKWLDHLVDTGCLAALAEEAVPSDEAFVANVKHYFPNSIQQAKRMIRGIEIPKAEAAAGAEAEGGEGEESDGDGGDGHDQ